MGYQSQEQTGFDGLVTTGDGTTVPRWSASDEINIDHQFRTIRGREPSTRVANHELPQLGYYCDGVSGRVGLGPATAAVTALGSTTFTFRIYVGGIDSSKLAAYASGTKFCVANYSANSTVAIETPLSGFNIYFNVAGSDLDLVCAFRTSTGLGTLTVADVGSDEFASPQDFKCIEFSRDSSNNYKLRIFSDATTKEGEASTSDSNTITTTQMSTCWLGAYEDFNTDLWEHHCPMIVGGVEIIDETTGDATTTYDRFQGKDRSDLPADYEFVWFPEFGVGYSDYAADQLNSSDGVNLFPKSPLFSVDEIQIDRGGWGKLDLSRSNFNATKAVMFMCRFSVDKQVLSTDAPPWLFTATGMNITINDDSGNYTLTCALGFSDADGNPSGSASLSKSGLVFGTTYQMALVLAPDKGTAFATDAILFVDANGDGTGWAYEAQTVSPSAGNPALDGVFYFATDRSLTRFADVNFERFAVFSGLDTIPTADASGATTVADTYDAFPADGGPLWPPRLVSFFRATSSFVRQRDTGNDQDANDRVTAWTGEFNPRHVVEFYPQHGINRWSAFRGITRAHRPQLKGVHPSVETIAGQTKKYINYLIDGAVYRYNQDDDSGELLQHPNMAGCPCSGVTAVDNGKDRLIMCGTNFAPVKVYPGGVGIVGLPIPTIGMAEQSSGGGTTGGLEASTTYYFKATIYNSQTGQESLPIRSRVEGTTGASEDQIVLRISTVQSASDDWDTIRIYRMAPDEGLNEYYLDTEVPRPKLLPPLGDDIDVTVGLSESQLLLQPILEDDNQAPPDFSAAALAARIMYVGGGGTNPGWVYYSKPLFTESFPPLNVFQLDNDQSNAVQAIIPIFGRLLIMKERGIWGGQDNIGEIAQEPALLHSDRGLVAKQAWAVADNTVYFMSPDRCVYATDGIEISDVSTRFIKDTLFDYSETQLADVQAVHDARSKSIWFSIPKSSDQSGADREVLVYRYDAARWQKYEMPHDSLSTGHDSSTSGSFGGFAYRGSFYRLERGDTNKESDAGSGESTFTYDYDTNDANESLVQSGPEILGLVSQTRNWDSSIEGMPVIIVPHDTAYDSADPESYHPLWDEDDDSRIYNYVRGVRTDGSDYYLWLGEKFQSNARYFWVGVGFQFRRYRSQWITPQGEDRPHMFYGATFVHNGEHTTSTTDPRFKYAVDYESFASGGWRTIGPAVRFPDTNHEYRRRSRRFRYEIVQGDGRGKKLEITRVAWRYRVRGPRRKR